MGGLNGRPLFALILKGFRVLEARFARLPPANLFREKEFAFQNQKISLSFFGSARKFKRKRVGKFFRFWKSSLFFERAGQRQSVSKFLSCFDFDRPRLTLPNADGTSGAPNAFYLELTIHL